MAAHCLYGGQGSGKIRRFELARDCARKILEHQCRTFAEYEPHTVWECYAPNAPEPARRATKTPGCPSGFCGWSALGPISLYLENVIGLWEADAFARTLNWSLPEKVKGRIGVRNYRFGDVLADLIVENGMLTARSSRRFRLILNGHRGGYSREENAAFSSGKDKITIFSGRLLTFGVESIIIKSECILKQCNLSGKSAISFFYFVLLHRKRIQV